MLGLVTDPFTLMVAIKNVRYWLVLTQKPCRNWHTNCRVGLEGICLVSLD